MQCADEHKPVHVHCMLHLHMALPNLSELISAAVVKLGMHPPLFLGQFLPQRSVSMTCEEVWLLSVSSATEGRGI